MDFAKPLVSASCPLGHYPTFPTSGLSVKPSFCPWNSQNFQCWAPSSTLNSLAPWPETETTTPRNTFFDISWTRRPKNTNHRNIEVFRLGKPSGIIECHHSSSTVKATTASCPQVPLCKAVKPLQGWGHCHCPEQPLPMPDQCFNEYICPKIQSKMVWLARAWSLFLTS